MRLDADTDNCEKCKMHPVMVTNDFSDLQYMVGIGNLLMA